MYRRTPAPALLLQMAIDSATYTAMYLENRDVAGKVIRAALVKTPIAQIPAAQRPWNDLARLAATMRDAALAREAMDGFERDLPNIGSLSPEGERARVRGYAALAAGRYDDALASLRDADRQFAMTERVGTITLAQAFDLAGKPDSAIAYFERAVGAKDYSLAADTHFRAGSYKRLGELYEAKGDTAKAESNYQKFVDLWKDADPELQPKVHEVRDRLARLRHGRG
jgi:tetratricopeptide (TPR) repeat protein